MTAITLYPHEIRRLLDHGGALLVRPVKPQPPSWCVNVLLDSQYRASWYGSEYGSWPLEINDGMNSIRCPHGAPGSTAWVRETWQIGYVSGTEYGGWPYEADLVEGPIGSQPLPMAPDPWRSEGYYLAYRADGDDDGPWRSPVTMPRWASRLSLEVVSIAVRQTTELTPADLEQMGWNSSLFAYGLWHSVHYGAKPWCWIISVNRL